MLSHHNKMFLKRRRKTLIITLFILSFFLGAFPKNISADTLLLKNGTQVSGAEPATGSYTRDSNGYIDFKTSTGQIITGSEIEFYITNDSPEELQRWSNEGGSWKRNNSWGEVIFGEDSPEQKNAIGNCIIWDRGISGAYANATFSNCVAQILYQILTIFSILVGIVGVFFNMVFKYTVINMATNIENIKIIEVGWTAVRDMANILFIFMILYLAIATILQLDEHGVKHGLSRLIVGAMLINFSLFFVKIPIDISNILAIEIYNKIQISGTSGPGGGELGLGDAIMSMFSPQKIYSDPTANFNGDNPSNNSSWNFAQNPISTFVMGIIIIFSATFIFLAVCIIFIKRFITLIMLMIFSPLAFAGMAIPNHNIEHEITHKFWNSLFKESFYAPVFMFMMYLTLKIGDGINVATKSDMETLGWSNLVPIDNVISYAVVLGMMILSLTVSETIGVKGASGAIKAFDSMRGATTSWIGANTVGRVASTLINSKRDGASFGDNMRNWAAGTKGNNIASKFVYTSIGRAAVTTLDKAGKPFDEKAEVSRKWMEEAISNQHGSHELTAQIFAQASSEGSFSVERKAADNQFHHMSLEQKANMKKHLEDMKDDNGLDATGKVINADKVKSSASAKAALDRYFEHHGHGRLEADEVAELPRMEAGELTYYDTKFREHIEKYKDSTPGSTGHTSAINDIREFIKNAKSENQMASAIKSLGRQALAFKGDGTKDGDAKAKNLRDVMSDEVRKKFSGGAFYENIGKDGILNEELRSAVAAGGYQQKLTYNLYQALTNSEIDEKGTKLPFSEAAKSNATLRNQFLSKLEKLDPEKDKSLIAAVSAYKTSKNMADFEKVLTEYKAKRAGSDEITKNLFEQTNGKRTQFKTAEIENEVIEVEKLIKSYGVKIKD